MTMTLIDVLIPTKIIRPGMKVRDVFIECGKLNVHSLPYCNSEGVLSGRLTLKNIMKFSCLPEHMVELANLLGSQMSCVENAEDKAREIICNPVEPYVRKVAETISSKEPLIKALAMMEKNETSYIFVVDEGKYRGLITIQHIARNMSELSNACSL